MSADKLYGKGQAIRLSLPEIFIPLYADKLLRIPKKDKTEIYEKQEDIEELIGKNEYLLIEGHPGSGKSKLLKHVTYSLSQGKSVKGLEGYLPIATGSTLRSGSTT